MSCGAETEANTVMTALLAGVSFDFPDVDLTDPDFDLPDLGTIDPPVQLTNAALTTKTVDGTGTFDIVMSSVKAHLQEQYDAGRITGDQFTKAYIELTTAAMTNAVQFLLGKDTAYYQAIRAKFDAMTAAATVATARVGLETAKFNLVAMQYEARNKEAEYALTKMKLATESIGYCTGKYNLDNILPSQKKMIDEQMESARAQTLDTRSDGITAVVGVLGKQKALYSQQITSYQRDAEVKMTKLFTDAWITMKTIDEGLLPPTSFNNASLDAILADLKTNHSLG